MRVELSAYECPCQRRPQLYQQNNTDITYWKSWTSHNLWFIPSTCTTVHGGRQKIFGKRGPIDIVYRVNMGVILPIRTANGKFFWEFWVHAPPGKFFWDWSSLRCIKSSAFWMQGPLGPFLNLPMVQCIYTGWEQLSLVLVNNHTNSC